MFLDILECRIENEKIVQGKLLKKCGLRNLQENQFCPQNLPKIVNPFMFFSLFFSSQFFALFFKKQFCGHKNNFCHKFETTFSKQFSPSNFCFVFLLSRNLCKLCHKVRNYHFYPIKVQILSIQPEPSGNPSGYISSYIPPHIIIQIQYIILKDGIIVNETYEGIISFMIVKMIYCPHQDSTWDTLSNIPLCPRELLQAKGYI